MCTTLRVPTPPGKSWNFYWKISRTWKVLEFARSRCGCQFFVSNRHIYADENSQNCWHQVRFLRCRCAKMLLRPGALPQTPLGSLETPLGSLQCSSCCLLLYLNVASLWQGPGKLLMGAWKVLRFFMTKRVGSGNPELFFWISHLQISRFQ